jgi:tetratricopeptide (TPR) repeat protein
LVSEARERAIVLAAAILLGAGSPGSVRDPELDRARRLVATGRYAEAREVLLRVLTSEQQDPEAHYLAGQAALHLGDYPDALRHLRLADQARPDDLRVLKVLGQAAVLAGGKTEAEQSLRRLTALAPSDAAAWSLLGRLYQDSSRFAEAADALERALTLDPHDVPALTALANARVGLGREAEALDAFRRSLEANRRRSAPLASAHGSFAVFLLRLNRVEEAREQLRLARAITPDDPMALLAESALRVRSSRPWPAGAGRPMAVPTFVDTARAAGLDVTLENSPTPRKHQIETMPGGVAVLDYDNDGFMDIYFTNGAESPALVKSGTRHWNRLYRNDGDGTFSDVTEAAGVAGAGYAMAAAAGDFDNDGFTDLFVAGVDRNILYRNDGKGAFTDVTSPAGLDRPHSRFGRMWGIHGAWLDYDQDGWLDLLVVNYCRWDPRDEPVCGDPAAGRIAYCHPRRFAPLPNQLFRNNRDGTFTDVSEASGIGRHLGKGMGAAVADLDGDGRPDIFVANDAEPSFLFWNRGADGFAEVALERGAAVNPFGLAVSAMGVDWRDLDEDGRPDLFVTALSNEGFLLLRNAGGRFEDGADAAGLGLATLPYSGWSNAIADFDNDGWKDLFSANGHALDDVERGQDRGYRQRNSLFQNMRDGSFRDVSREAGAGLQRVAPHRGAAVADFDNDGRLDIVVTALGERPSLLRNVTDTRAHWLSVRLTGRASNRLGLGAVLRVETPDGRVQWNHATTSVGFASSGDPRVHFGLGEHGSIRRLEVRWPSGRGQVLEGVAGDRVLELTEPPPLPDGAVGGGLDR